MMMKMKDSDGLQFSLSIEELAKKKNLSYIDAIVLYCEQTGLEIDVAAKLITENLKSKLTLEAENLHFIPKTVTERLPQ